MEALLAAIRKACAPATWSRGVELARSDAVTLVEESAKEIELRVATKGGLVAPLVTLFITEDEWSCECNWHEDACAHAAAAAIALQQSKKDGKPLSRAAAPASPGRVAYRFTTSGESLALTRVIVDAAGEHRLDGTLAAVALGKLKGPKFVAGAPDLGFEKKLGSFTAGVLHRHSVAKVIAALSGAADVTLDGKPIKLGAASCGLHVHVRRSDDGRFIAKLEKDPGVDKLFANGALIRGETLHALGSHGLPEVEYDELRRGKWFAPEDSATLAGDVIPRWRRLLPVTLEEALPTTRVLPPRIELVTARDGDRLTALATIVYGEPALARVDGDRLTILKAGDEVPLRNTRLERALIEKLRNQLGLEPGVRGTFEPGEAIAWTSRLARAELDASGDAHDDFVDRGALSPQLQVDGAGAFSLWFDLDGEGGGAKKRVDAGAVVRAWQRGESFAPLVGGGFGRIPDGWLARHGDRVAALLRARELAGEDGATPRWAMADLAALCTALEQPPPPDWSRLRALFEDFTGLPDAVLPADLRADLRAYQRDGVAWLAFLRDAGLGGLLADDMGLGKTLQALCAIAGRTLVVAPTSVLPNWLAEIAKFRPSLRACNYHGAGRKLERDADVVLTTYALLRLDQDVLAAEHWDCVVLDEAQAIKNPDSQVARAAFRLDGKFKLALTGTPVENRLDDLWSQLHFASPGLLGGRSEFLERYAKPLAAGDATAIAALRERTGPFVLRRLKREVAKELPPRTDLVLHCELREEERRVYDTVRAATQQQVAERLGAGDSVLAVLEALLRLRQAACDSALVPGQDASERASSKIELLLDVLDTGIAEGHKALVFSQWTSLLDRVEPRLAEANIPYVRLDGTTRDRGEVVARFQADDGPPVMLVSLRAGGTGLNLTAADHVFLLDPWWNPAVEDQAADRAHRIGQDKPVFVHRIVARGTVEEGILALQQRKRELAASAVSEGAGAATITRDDLLALLD
ncbi:MAG TPA: DEAD/DEAH box helicase [Nannocystaceae bacterium]|nr:DEAD/DEAH box helicase [Nannocystaceae bacterium]